MVNKSKTLSQSEMTTQLLFLSAQSSLDAYIIESEDDLTHAERLYYSYVCMLFAAVILKEEY